MGEQLIEVLVEGGKASAGPPIGSSLGPLGVNVQAVVEEINKKTAGLAGMQVPVKIKVRDDKSFSIEIGTPPVAALIKKELSVEKGSGEPSKLRVGDLTPEQVKKIAMAKFGSDSEAHCRQVEGAARSMGITVGKGAVTEEEVKAYEQQKAAEEAAEAAKKEAAAAAAAPPEGEAPEEAEAPAEGEEAKPEEEKEEAKPEEKKKEEET